MCQSHDLSLPSLHELRAAVPRHCFERSTLWSAAYLFRDLSYSIALIIGICRLASAPCLVIRIVCWILYGILQGFVGTGLWILAHECGHGAFSPYPLLNDVVGWCVHSTLLVPYFSWKITHARYHRFTGHLERDTAFVPLLSSQHVAVNELTAETPVRSLIHLLGHQLVGWQLYLLFYAIGGKDSFPESPRVGAGPLSHFNPHSALFKHQQRSKVLLSDLGILLMLAVLFHTYRQLGAYETVLLYFVPYMWVHHWIVAITYLHHTHPDVPHYSGAAWSFTKGAFGTVDRSFGFIGRHFFHDIIDHNVIHHLFPTIPFYHAAEATAAIRPLMGPMYRSQKEDNFLLSLWNTFRQCKSVEEAENPGNYVWK